MNPLDDPRAAKLFVQFKYQDEFMVVTVDPWRALDYARLFKAKGATIVQAWPSGRGDLAWEWRKAKRVRHMTDGARARRPVEDYAHDPNL